MLNYTLRSRLIFSALAGAIIAGCSSNEQSQNSAFVTAKKPVELKQQPIVPSDKWQLAWQDEFEGERINPRFWTLEQNCWGGGNNERARRLLDRAPEITAIFCQNDNIALAVYDVAVERDIVIGKDLSVVGFDNDYHSAHIRPRLTTVNFPVEEMGIEAAKGVLAIVQDQKVDIKQQLQPELIIRDSVGTL